MTAPNLKLLRAEAQEIMRDGTETTLENAYFRALARFYMRAAETEVLESLEGDILAAVREAQYNNDGQPVMLRNILDQMERKHYNRKRVERTVRDKLPSLRDRGLVRLPSPRKWSIPDAEAMRSKVA